ncbi:hypothetical protein DUNSADRAFT_6201 [Dunaliella salina]|uniref:Encoded protein n=1 Tax=Dunaliella salina TaxID=3046 RepID=A0ABQ7GNQ4_DUNSA|nr:hypothetical protein DUNSADRAFT_6201 [Dunaliella salina]|eukprot:KAF5836249.1 hypothetical protein DUNSADRAFT_6201 [Dunaliella salina]
MHHSQGTQVHTPPGADGQVSPRPTTSDKQGDSATGGTVPATRLGTPGSLQRHSAEQNLGRTSLLSPRASRQQTEQQLQDLTAKISALQADNAELHR